MVFAGKGCVLPKEALTWLRVPHCGLVVFLCFLIIIKPLFRKVYGLGFFL